MKMNPCVTGDTKVWTVDGVKSFKELAEENDDVMVYCLDEKGEVRISKMFHPRVSGYNVELVKVTLENGTEFTVTPNHQFLTSEGYVSAEDLMEEDLILTFDDDWVPEKIDEDIVPYVEYIGTKKGTVIKKCEVTGEEFECVWDEREICSKTGCENELYDKVNDFKENLEDTIESCHRPSKKVASVEFLETRENVYNGTVGVYHNYFTMDDNGTTVNQLNCGE